MPGEGEHESESVLGHRHGVSAGSVHDRDSGLGGGVEINVVYAYTGASDDAQLLCAAQDVCIHVHGGADDQRVGIGQRPGEIVIKLVRREHGPFLFLLQELNCVGGNFFSDDNLHGWTELLAASSWLLA